MKRSKLLFLFLFGVFLFSLGLFAWDEVDAAQCTSSECSGSTTVHGKRYDWYICGSGNYCCLGLGCGSAACRRTYGSDTIYCSAAGGYCCHRLATCSAVWIDLCEPIVARCFRCTGCECGNWSNAGCGVGGCAADEMSQTRNCTPNRCNSESRCVARASCSNSCTVILDQSPTPVNMGSSATMIANVTPILGTVDEVRFASDNTSVATAISPDGSSPYETQATGVSVGSATISADVIMGGAVTCTDTAIVDVSDPDPWFQVEDGDVMTSGDVTSSIPTSCVTPSCINEFDLEGAGGYPGVVIFGGSASFVPGGITSATSWEADTQTSYRKIYDYSFFDRLIGSDVTLTEIDSSSVNGGYFASGGSPARGYVWYHFDGSALGDLTINSNVNLPSDRKVILLVEGADLHIQGQEGIFLTEGQFQTGAGTEQLHIRGMVAAYDGIVLQRDLTDNSETPAELFEYAPDMVLTFPRDLTSAAIRWKEVAP